MINLRNIILLIYFLLANHLWIKAQEKKEAIDIPKFADENFSPSIDNINYEDLYETLYHYYITPLNLYLVSREELENLHILSELQLNNFFAHILKNGNLQCLPELQAIKDFDILTVKKILPFVKVEIKSEKLNYKNFKRLLFENESNYILFRFGKTLEHKKGFQNKTYQGSPDKMYFRLRSNTSKHQSFGITMEKDAGERIKWNPGTNIYGPDFLSYHFCIHNKFKVKTLVLGDYQMQFGQGLILGSGFNLGKGAESVYMTKKNNLGIRPYTSVMESGFFRGIATTISIVKNTDLTVFYSSKNIDANIQDTSENYTASGLSTFGYHRTNSEIDNQNKLKEKIYGSNLSFSYIKNKLHIGISGLQTTYDLQIIKIDKPYNKFDFSGNKNSIGSVDISLIIKNFNVFGELAYSTNRNSGNGGLVGFIGSLSKSLDIALLYRNYSKSFISFYGNAFGENSRNINEQGLYWGIKFTPNPKCQISAYVDKFYYPWLKYRVDGPSQGHETLLRILYRPHKKTQLNIQWRFNKNQINNKVENQKLRTLQDVEKNNITINLDTKYSPIFSFKSRIQWSYSSSKYHASMGIYMMQEISLDYKKISLDLRYAVFDTDGFENRQFSYERDLLHAFSISQLNGQGTRYYVLAKFKILPNLDISCKYSKTTYFNVEKIGSGLDQINGNKLNEIRLQLYYKI